MTSPDLGPSTSVTQAAMIINFWTNHANVNNSAEVELFVNGRLRWGTLDAGWSWVLIKAETGQAPITDSTCTIRRLTRTYKRPNLSGLKSGCRVRTPFDLARNTGDLS